MPPPKKPARVREPVQVYLAGDDRALLARIAAETGLSKAEILRRGIRSFAREQGGASPMERLLDTLQPTGWPSGTAAAHDAALAVASLDRHFTLLAGCELAPR